MVSDRELMRLIHGELEEDRAREIEGQLAHDPRLEARYRGLAEIWGELEAPPAEPVPEGFSARLADHARQLAVPGAGEFRWSLAPAWARAGSAAALVVGLALGISFGRGDGAESAFDSDQVMVFAEPMSLAESFWLSVEEDRGSSDEESRSGDATP